MAFSPRLGLVGLCGGLWLVAVGCGDSSDKKVVNASDGGEGGEAPTGGKASGGSSNTAGKAGAAGSGGTDTAGAGAGGMGIGGDAGNGQGGGAPVVGVAGAGGTSEGGAGGAGGVAADGALSCLFSCANDDDCLKPGNDTTFRCNATSKRCEDRTLTCGVQSDCLAHTSYWPAGCTINDDCGQQEACVAFRGAGFCAPMAIDGCGVDAMITLPLFDGGGDQAVCGSADARCIAGACSFGCAVDGCGDAGGVCNAASGVCTCETGADCDSGVCQASRCVSAPCVTSDDCAGDDGLDTCVNGKCGCGSSDSCGGGVFANAQAVCE
jgi:hypothetical protein